MPDISLLAVLLATVSSFILGGIWYGPMFGSAWMAAHNFDAEQLRQNFNPVRTYGITFLIGLATAYTFGMFLGRGLGWNYGATYGLIAGLVWVGGSLATNQQFERTSPTLLMINGGYHTLRFALMGAILGGL